MLSMVTVVGAQSALLGRLRACITLLVCVGCSDQAAIPDGAGGHNAGTNAGGSPNAGSGGSTIAAAGTSSAGAGAGTGGASAGTSGSAMAGGGVGGSGSAGASAGLGGTAMAGSGGGSALAGAGGAAGSPSGEDTKVVLFGGQDLSKWKAHSDGGPAPWNVADGAFSVAPGSGDIDTRQSFGDIQLHVEFWIPTTPASNAEQDRGNSGVYLQGRYEVQVLDSYQHPLEGANDCGAIYELKNADANASLPPENWQTYDITFHAARWSGNTKTANAKISVMWNGQQAQKDVEVPAPTKLGDPENASTAPLRLQDHSHSVRYRNIWLREL